jgi:hypothetical protein
MADRLNVAELDFDTIKQNLKNFLKQQNEFTDYDFDGSGLSVLLDILAYNTHYQAYYLNMIANESFLDSALLRDSVVSHAKTLGYTPYSKKSSVATIDFTVETEDSSPGTLTIPKGYRFLSNQIDGRVYNFIVLNDTTVTKSGTRYVFENLNINEGQLASYRFVQSQQTNPKQIFTLPEDNIDTQTLRVTVSPSLSNTSIEVYELVTDVTETTAESKVYFLQESRTGKYEIYFGNDVLGKSIPDDGVVTINYLITNGQDVNKANNFVAAQSLIDTNEQSLTNFIIESVESANGGSDRETINEIKYSAPLQFASQNRLITYKDYEVFIRNAYPNLDSVSVWGGEDEVPPIFGKVFVSLKPKDGFFISQSEKDRILNTIIEPKSIITIVTEFRDPEYLFINLTTTVQYDSKRTTLSLESLRNTIKNSILIYKNQYLDVFNARFAISKLQEAIDSVDTNSIVGSDAIIRVQKRFVPLTGTISNYNINFNISLVQGTPFNKITSSEFIVNDSFGIERSVTIEEVPKSFTGINSIDILNSGTGFTSEPTVTITGDGFGATAKAIISFGKIQRIEILNPGIDYNRAVVTITGGGGFGAQAVAVIDTKIGKLRTVYFTSNAERVIVNSNVGTINYDEGIIILNDLNILRTETFDGLVRIDSGIQNNIIQSTRNVILTIDENDLTSIVVNLQTIQ